MTSYRQNALSLIPFPILPWLFPPNISGIKKTPYRKRELWMQSGTKQSLWQPNGNSGKEKTNVKTKKVRLQGATSAKSALRVY
ncbi:hypothetical protein SUGI_0284390 [Cryptomeria japonica]|nr:hypothetical protein SUGI_0284390 [Cryptomeria japonica]